VHFNKANESRTNVTELTKGVYVIGLTVTDGNGNNASDIVKITVYQSKIMFNVKYYLLKRIFKFFTYINY